MSKITTRDPAAHDDGSVEDRLDKLLESPLLPRLVPHLPPETLHQLIRSRGLEACGELVTSATPAQLTSLFDLDLWRGARPGRPWHNDQFDVDRFGEWLDVLVDAGHSVAARTVASLDKDLVVTGLSRYVRVFDPGIFEPIAQSDDELIDRHDAMREGDSLGIDDEPTRKVRGEGLEREVAGYIVRARRTDAWEAIVALLAALDAEHHVYFDAVMQGCRRLSNSRPEIDGLDDLLLEPEQHLHDVAMERERRRSQQGYATSGDAHAFLEMARRPKPSESGPAVAGTIAINPIVAAYFRAADEAPEPPDETETSSAAQALPPATSHPGPGSEDTTEIPESIDAVMELLTEAGVMPARPRALLEAPDGDPQTVRLERLRRLMAHVRDTNEAAYLTRTRELAFLANTLVAGCSVQSRSFTPQEASDAAAAICNLGLEYWSVRWPGAVSSAASSRQSHDALGAEPPDSWLIGHELVTAFEVGWRVLYEDVSLFAAEHLISTLKNLHGVDREMRRELNTLRRRLVTERDAGTPWRARDAMDVLAALDGTVWVSVRGLLDECPVLPAALTAVLERRTTSVSPTAFDFISTAVQIGDAHAFMQRLPDLLSR